ncbi:hypothetical protein X798_01709 [Onchocerca flexuosa]|uniref:Uncharacterized protein n=1 Tax=Onchocerca flexuosa TaxID=387005 RepID=A0A238C1G1_9BILA|nr:hypothetical protein X798_01709 [Onchocerca flexuosa]
MSVDDISIVAESHRSAEQKKDRFGNVRLKRSFFSPCGQCNSSRQDRRISNQSAEATFFVRRLVHDSWLINECLSIVTYNHIIEVLDSNKI